MIKNTGEYLEILKKNGELCEIEAEVDCELELAEIHRRVVEANGKCLLFKKIKGKPFPVVSNMFGSQKRIELAFGKNPSLMVAEAVKLAHELLPPSFSKVWKAKNSLFEFAKIGTYLTQKAPVLQHEIPLKAGAGALLLPALKQWPEDGGNFLTFPAVYSENPHTKTGNMGMYRMQIYDEKNLGMHWQIHRSAGNHYFLAESMQQALPVTVFLGGPPALSIAAIAPVPENIPNLLLCSLLMGGKVGKTKIKNLPHPIVSECDFALVGKVPPFKRRLEGPFGDHFGYYSLAHDFPVFELEKIYHREKPIFPVTVVGVPRQEDYYIGNYVQTLLAPFFPLVMPGVIELHSYGETGFHGLAAAKVQERYAREIMVSGFRILGEGQLSLQKYLMLTNGKVDLMNFKSMLQYFLERTNWATDLFIFANLSQDTLDYTGPKLNHGSKAIWVAAGDKVRDLATSIPAELPSIIIDARVFVPGCLVISGEAYADNPKMVEELRTHPAFSAFQLIIVCDDALFTTSSEEKFLWTMFTRSEPAADIYASKVEFTRYHPCFTAPIFFDCRMKPWYPKVVEPLKETVELVDKRWKEYFVNK